MTDRPIAIAVLNQALGCAGDPKNYDLRLTEGYEFCKRWLEKNRARHGIELDDGVLEALRFLCAEQPNGECHEGCARPRQQRQRRPVRGEH